MTPWAKKRKGFTIVELLIVIVVIAILAAISIVAYNGIQQRARDTQRKSDITTITKALELYYVQNGEYPPSHGSTSTAINGSWNTTADSSWSQLEGHLVPKYISKLPYEPTTGSSLPGISGGVNYDYIRFNNTNYCGSSAGQGYLLVYHLESGEKDNKTIGVCGGTPLGYYSAASNYRVVK